MANRFWVTGGTGNWNSTTNWSATSGGASGASVPGSADAALLDASSGAGTVTLDISPVIQTLNCAGFTGTLAFGTNTISLNSTGTVFTGATTMTVTGTPQIICTNSSATSRTISPQAVTESNSISFRITAGTGALSLASGGYRNVDLTDGTNPTGYAGALTVGINSYYGNFKASTGMTVTSGTSALTFAATSGVQTITSAGVTFDRPFTVNSPGATVQLQDNLMMGSTRTFTLTNGTLDLNNLTLSTGIFSSLNSNTRVIEFGTGEINLTGNAAVIFNIGVNITGFSHTGTSKINCTYAGADGTRTIQSGTSLPEAQSMNFNITGGSDIVAAGSSTFQTFRNLNFTGFSGTLTNISRRIYGDFTLSPTMTLNAGTGTTNFQITTGSQLITTNGLTLDFPIQFNGIGGTMVFNEALTQGSTRAFTIFNGRVQLKAGVTSTVGSFVANNANVKFLQSTTLGSQATLSQASGTVDTTYLTIRDINATGGATWNAFVNQFNVDAGNNDGWDFGISPVVGATEYTYRIRSFTQPRRF